jgi:hypothetical protein
MTTMTRKDKMHPKDIKYLEPNENGLMICPICELEVDGSVTAAKHKDGYVVHLCCMEDVMKHPTYYRKKAKERYKKVD